jgi:hypothetical protein
MNSTDAILTILFSTTPYRLNQDIPSRDRKILSSLWRQITSGHFLTENQANLLVKIFKENLSLLDFNDTKILNLIDTPVWSQSFRKVEQVRKLYISDDEEKTITIEFSYNKRVKEQLSKITKEIDGFISSVSTKKFNISLTEKNVLIIVKNLKNLNFEIDQKITDFYQEITAILKAKENIFELSKIENKKLISNLSEDVGNTDHASTLLLEDRKIRYQYSISSKISPSGLAEKIAIRTSPKVFINKKTTELSEIVESLVNLKRLPILFIFSGHESKDSIQDLQNLSASLEKNSINSDIGIYFRFDNITDSNKEFNETVNLLNYNSVLSPDTKIVGLANNKLPKFIMKEKWRPNSVISFTNNFKNNKTSVYCDNVDLIIYYHDREPLGDINAIV